MTLIVMMMKRRSSLHDWSRTIHLSFLILLIHVLVVHNTSSFGANAQLYQNCQRDSSTGVTLQSCLVNRLNPLTYVAADGTAITLGTDSFAVVECETTGPGTIDTCTCFIVVNPSNPIEETDTCTSCTVTAISDTVFDNIFDCSNRLTGSCVGLDSSGACISSVDGAPVTPVSVPVSSSAPVAEPTAPTESPVTVTTPVPVEDSTPTATPVVGTTAAPVEDPAPMEPPMAGTTPAPVEDPVPSAPVEPIPAPVTDPVPVVVPVPVADPTTPVTDPVTVVNSCKGKDKGKCGGEGVTKQKKGKKGKKGKKKQCKKSKSNHNGQTYEEYLCHS